jgi:hypothetical protein
VTLRALVAATAVLLPLLAVGGCGGSAQDDYCDALADSQPTLQRLSAGAADPKAGDLARSIDVFETLRSQAPEDLADEWDTYLNAWQALDDALHSAGADESMFKDGSRPEGMSRNDYRTISAAAADLRSTRVVAAGAGIEQQALDVCGVDLDSSGLGS